MPGNLLFSDQQFPSVTGDKQSDLKQILNYMYMLQEQLRYTLGNIGTDNINTNDFTISANNINFEGFATFLTAADVGAGGTTTIDGGRINTGTLATESLSAIDGGGDYSYIAMLNGLDFRDTDHMIFDEVTYIPYKRSVQGLHALVFHGDTVLTSTGKGTTNNEPTAVTGYLRNMQSDTGAVTQSGVEFVSARKLKIEAQAIGGLTVGAGVELYSRGFDAMANGEYSYVLQVTDTGIYGSKYQKIAGVVTALDTTPIYTY